MHRFGFRRKKNQETTPSSADLPRIIDNPVHDVKTYNQRTICWPHCNFTGRQQESNHSDSEKMESLHLQLQSHLLTPENVAAVPPPGMSGPNQICFAPNSSRYLAFVSATAGTNHVRNRASQSHTSSSIQTKSPYLPLTDEQSNGQNKNTNKTKKGVSNPISVVSTSSGVTAVNSERTLQFVDIESDTLKAIPLLKWNEEMKETCRSSSKRRMLETSSASNDSDSVSVSLDDRLKRDRQRLNGSTGSITQFSWTRCLQQPSLSQSQVGNDPKSSKREDDDSDDPKSPHWRLLVPARGSLYVQDGFPSHFDSERHVPFRHCTCIHDKDITGMTAVDAQLSPDGSMVAWSADGEIYVQGVTSCSDSEDRKPSAVRISFGAMHNDETCISHGVADFIAQEEMDRFRGFWWHPDSKSILFTRNDESKVPLYRIMHNHQDSDANSCGLLPTNNSNHDTSYSTSRLTSGSLFEDHRYPFAGKLNPSVRLGLLKIHKDSIMNAFLSSRDVSYSSKSIDESRSDRDEVHSRYDDPMQVELTANDIASENWEQCQWFDPPREASEYLARVYWLPDGTAITQWQNRIQNCSILYRIDTRISQNLSFNGDKTALSSGLKTGRTLLVERSEVWINLHHVFRALDRPIHPDECLCDSTDSTNYNTPMPKPLPDGSFSFLFASERSGYQHLYLYTYCPGVNGEQAVLIKTVTRGEWMVEHIIGVDLKNDLVFFVGTYDSPLERHLYAIPLRDGRAKERVSKTKSDDLQTHALNIVEENFPKSANGVRRGFNKVIHAFSGGTKNNSPNQNRFYFKAGASTPIKLTSDSGMHSLVMDDSCKYFVDTSSDLDRPTTVKIYEIIHESESLSLFPTIVVKFVGILYDASIDDKAVCGLKGISTKAGCRDLLLRSLPAPELISFPTTDGSETLHAALYRPDPARHGPGPYPLACAVYGGPHVQRVNRSWAQCADMRAQRLRSLGFCVIKCDNRGSSRRGLKFESAISKRLGRVEVIDQVTAVRQLTSRGIADASRVGVYGWSYGGYLAAMCLCRAPDVFHVAVAGAPVTSWDGYDTHYTERYMGLPAENISGYRESAVFDHVPNMKGKLMIVHGLIDENVHFRHSSRLINRLIAAGKDYDLLVFPEERHSPRRLRDRIYMEQRICDYFVKHLAVNTNPTALDIATASSSLIGGVRTMAGHL